jgi:mono/diheme cytochrome c family protein
VSKAFIFFGILLIGLAISACNAKTERPPNKDQLMGEGARIYLEYCAECHQTHGQGWSTLYPNLAGNPIVTLHDPERIIRTVKYGQGSMMPFREKLTGHEMAAVLTYIRNSWGNSASAVSWRQIH